MKIKVNFAILIFSIHYLITVCHSLYKFFHSICADKIKLKYLFLNNNILTEFKRNLNIKSNMSFQFCPNNHPCVLFDVCL